MEDYIIRKVWDGAYVVYLLSEFVSSFNSYEEARTFVLAHRRGARTTS